MREKVQLSDVLLETLEKLDGDGILLVAGDPPNPMTIGWGTRSGRDINKLEACNLHIENCLKVNAYFISESTIHFECRTVHRHFLDHSTLDPAISKKYYPQKDFHMVFYGEILGIYRKL